MTLNPDEREANVGRLELGDVAKDIVTGYQGMVVGITEWLNGCRRIGVQARELDKNGKPVEIQWIDEGQLEIVKKQEFQVFDEERPRDERPKETGGPMPTPTRNEEPGR